MSKWKCGICGSGFDNFQAQGFEGTIYCPLCYYKKLYKDTELERKRLNKQYELMEEALEDKAEEIERLNNIIKEAREYLKDNACYNDMGNFNDDLDYDKCGDLLEILDKGE